MLVVEHDTRVLGVSVRVPIMLGVADRDHQDVQVDVAVGSAVGVADTEPDDRMVWD